MTEHLRWSRPRTLLTFAAVYAVVLAVGWAWLRFGPNSASLLLDSLIADLLMTVSVFAVSRFLGNTSAYDLYWSVIPPAFFGWWLIGAGQGDSSATAVGLRLWLIGLVVFVWGMRLTLNWCTTYPGHPHEDWRYPMLRAKAPKLELLIDFFALHLFPTVVVFLAMLPMYAALVRAPRTSSLGWADWLATLVGLGGAALSFVADRQMQAFARAGAHGRSMRTGLWAWSRHPNYLGEIMFWVSLAIFGVAAAPQLWWWGLVGVLPMVAMFRWASIPMMEERSLERRGDYQEVIDTIPMLLPRRPR